MPDSTKSSTPHWNDVFATKDLAQVSWFQSRPHMSLDLIGEFVPPTASIVDVGTGASFLGDHLIDSGHSDITLLDISSVALDVVKARLGDRGTSVHFEALNITDWIPTRRFDAWHDRAVFHFLPPGDRDRYVRIASTAVEKGGVLILGTFAPDGPEQCSGLEVHRYDSEMIARIFFESFVLVKSLDERHTTPFDTVQHFTWSVLRRV